MATAPQKIAVRRLVRGADGQMRSILVDAYSYTPITDTTGYKVVDVGDVPEQVQDVTQPDAEKPVVDKTTTASIDHTGSDSVSNSSRAFGQVPSTKTPSKAQAFPSAPSTPKTTQTPSPISTPATQPSVGSNMPTVDSTEPSTAPSTPSSTPSTPSNPPGYSQANQGATPQNYSPATPNAAAFAAGNQYYTGDSKTYDFSNPNAAPAPSSGPVGYQAQGQATPRNIGDYNGTSNTGPAAEPGYSSPSGNNNGRGTGLASTPSMSPGTNFGGMYGGAGFGGGYAVDTSPAKDTVSAAGTPQSASERSQAMGSVPDSASSPAAAAARGQVSRTQAQLDRIGLTIAGEVTGQTLANLTSPDPQAQADARAQVANIQTTMENRAATAPWGTIEKAVVPGQYDALNPGKELNTSKNNFAKYNASIMATVKDYYTGLNPPTNYNFTNYANTAPIAGVYNPPGWLGKIQDPTQVGPFTFGTDPAYANPDRYTPEAQANYAAAGANYGASGAYQKSPDYGTDPGWGNYGTPGNNNYTYGNNYGQSSISPGWGNFAGADNGQNTSGGNYTSDSGNGNGRGSGLSGGIAGGGGSTSYGGGSGYGQGSGGNGTASGGGAGMSGGGGYSPGGMGSPSGSSNDSGSMGSRGDENGDTGGGGAGTRSNGNGSFGGL